jgi:hypothetical protein
MGGVTQPDLPAPLAELVGQISEMTESDFAAALPQMTELLTFCRTVSGELDPSVLDFKVAVANARLQTGDYAGAYADLERLLPELDEVLGRDHVTTLAERHLFADRPLHDPQAALAEWSQLVDDEQRVLGAEHPATLMSRDRVAHKRKELGDYSGAIAEGEQVLAARRRVLGDDHEDTLGMRMSLAQWHGESIDGAGAVAELEQLVDVMREKLGDDHRHTLITRHTLALWGPKPDDPRDAVAEWEALVDDEARVFGDDNSATVAAREELAKCRDELEEHRWVAEQIYKSVGMWESDDDESSGEEVESAHDDAADSWAAAQERAFPEWVARFGGGQLWDFTTESLQDIAGAVFHRCSAVADLDDPANADFTDGITWYLGEILRRSDPREWRWVRWDEHEPTRADEHRLARGNTDKWPIAPRQKLNRLIESGNPLDLYHDDHYVSHTQPWTWGYFDNTDTGGWTWTGQGWQSQLELWLDAVAGRISTLASDYLPDGIALDYSIGSLRRIEEFALASGIDDPAFTSGVAAYVGETLLRTVGGRWLWDDAEHSATRGFPVVRPHLDGFKGTISPTHLLSFALQWRDGETLTRVYQAQRQRVSAQQTEDPAWQAMRSPTPGLDAIEEAAPDYCDTWRAQREREFADWVARYGPDHAWDFSRDSLSALGEIVLNAPEGAQEGAKECAAWYFGEALHRARPSRWHFNQYQYDLSGRVVGENPASPWWISITTHSRVGFAGNFPTQDIDWPFRQDSNDSMWLRKAYDHWITAEPRDRVEQCRKRRLNVKRKAWRKLSDDEYLRRWLGEREAGFEAWVRDYGGDAVWDFSPDSLGSLEALVVQRGSTPEQLLDDQDNAPLVDGALWYLGEVYRHGRALPWEYARGDTADPTVGHVEVLDVLTRVLTTVDPGALRRSYDAFKGAV